MGRDSLFQGVTDR